MPSSTSSSDPRAWRRFFCRLVGAAAAVAAAIALFVAVVDPFDTLPLSPELDRPPIATNARFSFPALARKQRFDSAVIGTSTSRLLNPAVLDPAFDARFVNLAMNAATSYEQSRILDVFLDAHPQPKVVIIGLDDIWCLTRELRRYTPRPFPEWMFSDNRWLGYREMLNLYTVQQAGIQLATLLGLKPAVYARNGYTSFVPDDRLYDPARVAFHLRQAAAEMPHPPAHADVAALPYPALDLLRDDLARIPAATRVVIFLAPFNHVIQPTPGGGLMQEWNECKRRVSALANARPNTTAVDFMLPSGITDNDENYWDSAHYRIGIADRIVRDLAAAAGQASPQGGSPDGARPSDDYRILAR